MKMLILLTPAARRFAEERGWTDRLEALQLGAMVQVGDRVALGDDATHDFKAIRRRILATDEEPTLQVTLDYPARS